MSPAAGPLSGVTVLDLSTVGPAARCTRLLADYGACVVKVGPVPSADAAPIEPQFFAYSGHRGMRRVLVDLKDDDGREAFLALAAAADVVVESFRPGRGRPPGHRLRRGVGAQPGHRLLLDERLRPGRPGGAVGRARHRLPGRGWLPGHEHAGGGGRRRCRGHGGRCRGRRHAGGAGHRDDAGGPGDGVVYCSTSGYGHTGPASHWAGHDIDYLGRGRLPGHERSRARRRAAAPRRHGRRRRRRGHAGRLAITAASGRPGRSGRGAYLDVSVADGVLWLMSLAIDEQLALGGDIRSRPRHPLGPLRLLRHLRGGGRQVAGGGGDRGASSSPTCAARSGCPSWRPPTGRDAQDRHPRRLRRGLRHARAADEWVEALAGADTCVAPVLEVAEVAADPQFAARGVVAEATHPTEGTFSQLAPLLAGMPPAPTGR